MLSLQSKLIKIAQKRQEAYDKKHNENNQPNSLMQYAPNSFVLVLYPKTSMGSRAPTKLHTHWKGPMRVIGNTGAEYIVHDLIQDKNMKVHVSRLKNFDYEPQIDDPTAIAAKDYEEDEVESILAHQGDPRRKGSLDFLVRWTGFDESEDLWLPWSSLRDNVKLHQYLRVNGMAKLIPK